MSKKLYIVLLLIIIMVFNIGCSSQDSNNDKIAYISSNTDSEYEKTFNELNLGILFDFDLKLPKADKSWVDIWVEGYSNGEAMEPSHLTHLSYGLSPKELEEGKMGLGIINPNSDQMQFFLYSPSVRILPHIIENIFPNKSGITYWDYAIGTETIGLVSGEEKVLAVYRQVEKQLITYDFQDPESISKMINEDKLVLLLKIKVEEKNEL